MTEACRTASDGGDGLTPAIITSLVEGRQPSVIADHQDACCEIARGWIRAIDVAHRDGGRAQPPAWIRQKWDWGPTPWPLYWCDVVTCKTLDCGGLAALTQWVMDSDGASPLSVQMVQRYGPYDASHWEQAWASEGLSATWVIDGIAYHEAVAIRTGGRVEVWDPTDRVWVGRTASRSYGGLLAVRFVAPASATRPIRWHGVDFPAGGWVIAPFDETN